MFIETEIYKYGLKIENIVIDYLESNEYEIIEKYNNDNSHDIIVKNIVTNKQFNIEIKGDRQAYKTNNFYIEYTSHDMPSGINTTKSEILIYVIDSHRRAGGPPAPYAFWSVLRFVQNERTRQRHIYPGLLNEPLHVRPPLSPFSDSNLKYRARSSL